MKLFINDRGYELDKAAVEAHFITAIMAKLNDLSGEAGIQRRIVKSAIGSVMGHLSGRYPELRRPEDMDTLEHAARSVVSLLLAEWEREPLRVRAQEVERDDGEHKNPT